MSDQVDELDAFIGSLPQGMTDEQFKAKLSALLVAARLNERKELALDTYRGQTFSESTNWQAKFDKFVRNNEYRIAELEKLQGGR